MLVRPLYRHYFQNTQAIIYVIDSNDTCRITEAGDELHKFLQEDELRDCVVLLLANKQDLSNAMTVSEITEKIRFTDIKQKHKHILGTVATTGENLFEGMDWISQALSNKDNSACAPLIDPLKETAEDVQKIASIVATSSWNNFIKSYSLKVAELFKIY